MPKAFWSLVLVVFVDLLGFGIIIPILPYYAQVFGANGKAVTLLFMSYSLMQFLFAPIWGRWSDRVGRRPILLLSLLGSSVSMLILGLAPSYEILLLGRVLAGIFAASISTAYACASDLTSSSNRSKAMGFLGAALGLGFTLGPAVGGLLSQWGYSTPMFFGSALAMLNFIWAWFELPESKTDKTVSPDRGNHLKFFLLLWKKHRDSAIPILLFALLTFSITQLEVTFALYMSSQFAFSARDAGLAMAGIGMIMVMTQGGLIGRLTKRFSEKKLAAFSMGLCSISLYFFGAAHSLTLSLAALVILSFGRGIAQPTLSSLTSLKAPDAEKGRTMGLFHSASSLARVLGPLTAGWLYDHIRMQAPFFLGALVLLLTWGWVSFQWSFIPGKSGFASTQ